MKLIRDTRLPAAMLGLVVACLIGGTPATGAPSGTKNKAAVTEWFKKYDQIRRDAEETSQERYQTLFLGENKPDEKNAALAKDMVGKYTRAAAAMKQLPQVPETRELHKGYLSYFTSARQLFAEFLKAQKIVPYTIKHLVPSKNNLSNLDKANKKLDADLREIFGIPKHKHS